ncbi:hypothetical protein Tco_1198369, partial [Tanacetum coccineum]
LMPEPVYPWRGFGKKTSIAILVERRHIYDIDIPSLRSNENNFIILVKNGSLSLCKQNLEVSWYRISTKRQKQGQNQTKPSTGLERACNTKAEGVRILVG